MKKELLFMIAVTTCLCSCTVVGTLHPLSENENQFVYKKELVGKWNDSKNVGEWYNVDTMAGNSGKLYMIDQFSRRSDDPSKVDTLCFLARLVQVGETQFLECKMDCDRMFADQKSIPDLMVAKHFIIKTSFTGPDKMELTVADPDELIKLIKAGKVKLHYTEVKKDDYLILNDPQELQRATETLKKYPNVYKNKTELTRS